MLALLTGQRKSNVLQMQWSEIDLRKAEESWRIPGRKTKTKRNYVVALTPDAAAILARRIQSKTTDYVFPSESQSSNKPYRASIQHAWARICDRAGFDDLNIHDLRHTAGTWMALNGASAFQIKEALQHANVATSQRYIHMANSDVRSVMAAAQANARASSR